MPLLLIWRIFVLVLTLSVLAVACLVMGIWLAVVQREQTSFLRLQLTQRDQTIEKMQNLLMSRDPMTYATLSQVTTPSQTFGNEPYISMSDEAEAARYAAYVGGVGDVVIPDEELMELGLRNDYT